MTTVAQLLMVGIEGTRVTSEHRLFLKETGVGGVILFKRNYESPRQLAELIRGLQEASAAPLLVAVDQEGGRVARFREGFTLFPPMAALGRLGEAGIAVAEEAGRVLGRELSAVGVNCDFAPVLDVNTNPSNPVIGDRALAHDPALVAHLGCALIRGLQGEGVAACGKHFPGHGDTDVDSHLGLPLLPHTRRRFEELELVPFRAAIEGGVASMMTAHLMIPSLDASEPASVSRPITLTLLRRELGYNGVVFTDDLTMKGITGKYPPAEAAWRSIAAGADIALICHHPEEQRAALEGLRKAVGEGWIPMKELAAAMERVAALKSRYADLSRERPSIKALNCREHQKIAAKMHEAWKKD